MNFNEISKELIEKIDTDKFNVHNDRHMDAAKEVLSKYITDEELLSYVLFSLKFPDMNE
jgi:hypothetical protein